ncbi:FxsA family protein [Nocardioides sp.]|uniref:FxsA family protein n=1 Tax=Nocardioides sp. TaxID=35761 RepID=UPI003528B70B
MTRRRRLSLWLLFVAFVVLPLVEIYVLIQVGQVIGAWPTVLVLVADSMLGAWIVRHEGRRAWQALNEALASGRMPASEIADGALILVGGALMLTPGFVTDILGALAVLPFTRPIARRLLAQVVSRRLLVVGMTSYDARRPGPPAPGEGPVVRGDVVD